MGIWTIMGTAEEREAFWRSHHEAWQRSNLNQREYCEAHGLVLKRFENWRAKFKDEPEVPQKLLYRRGGRPSHMTGHMTVPMTKEGSGSMAVLAAGVAGRRRFSEEDRSVRVSLPLSSGTAPERHAQQQRSRVRADLPAIKSSLHPAAFHQCKAELFCATLCRHRSTSLGLRKSLSQNNFLKACAPMHPPSVRFPG